MKYFAGTFDIVDGKIIEGVSKEKAEAAQYKHPGMFSVKSNLGYKECRYGRFTVYKDRLLLLTRDSIDPPEREKELMRVLLEQNKEAK